MDEISKPSGQSRGLFQLTKCIKGKDAGFPIALVRVDANQGGGESCVLCVTIRPMEISSYVLHDAWEVGSPIYIFRFPAVPLAR